MEDWDRTWTLGNRQVNDPNIYIYIIHTRTYIYYIHIFIISSNTIYSLPPGVCKVVVYLQQIKNKAKAEGKNLSR